jgi:hypothetical protein
MNEQGFIDIKFPPAHFSLSIIVQSTVISKKPKMFSAAADLLFHTRSIFHLA